MNLIEKKTRITNMLRQWNQDRWNKTEALDLLSSGAYYSISPKDVQMWINSPIKPERIHSYIGVENHKLYFILIDSETDKKPLSEMTDLELDKIIIKKFDNNLDIFTPNFISKTIDGNVSVTNALIRNFCWQLMKGSWVEDQIESVRDMQVGIARVFSSPFSDLEEIHKAETNTDIIAVMGLKHIDTANTETIYDEKSPFQLDLCFWSLEDQDKFKLLNFKSSEDDAPVEDLTLICPPYEERNDKFSLIFP
ncbi:hypothetical protein L3073_05225 [Ancylomarina sp. DW003]|nr:hypothetical protein [Ancylomarina sp. DW003]MDE5421598.1 hypothetical protein [Ancylomarina sp. DW003]